MKNVMRNTKLDRRDELILIIVAIVTPLAALPAMLGVY